MEQMPTAEEWLKHFEENAYPSTSISECMIEFAKLHVEAALKEASEKSIKKEGQITDRKLSESILNSYPLENIK